MTRSQKVIRFIETLCCPDGADVGEPLILRPWQKKWIRKVYRTRAGSRLVRQAVLSMPRKNGKSALIAALVLVHLCGPEAIINGQAYSVSFEREQAGIVFDYVSSMIYMDEELSDRLSVIESRKRVVDRENGSKYSALSSESKSKHGKSASFVVFDELAQFGSDRQLYDVMLTSCGAHDEPIFFVISTQARDDIAVLSELIDYGLKNPKDETFCADLFSLPNDMDIWAESNWHIANPALGDFRKLHEMKDFAKKAKAMPSAEATFRNLYLNQRIDTSAAWIARPAWDACAGEIGAGKIRFAGLDLSQKNDLTALEWVMPIDGALHADGRRWKPADNIADHSRRDKAPYDVWARSGHLLTTPGKTIDYGFVAAQIAALHREVPFAGIAFDRWRINDLVRAMQVQDIDCWLWGSDWEPGKGQKPDGIMLWSHGQGFKDMGVAIERLEDAIMSQTLRHSHNPVVNMCCANAITVTDPAGSRKFEKRKSFGRIDSVVALAMAVNFYYEMRDDRGSESIYENRGIRTL